MIRDARAGVWTETALFALASVLLAQMGLGVFLFLAPLQILFMRRGAASLAAGAGLTLTGVGAVRLISAAASHALGETRALLFVEIFAIAILLVGLVIVNVYDGRPPLRFPLRSAPRLLMATAVGGLLCVPVVLAFRTQNQLGDSITSVFRAAADGVAKVFTQGSSSLQSPGGVDASALAKGMVDLALQVFPRTFLLYYFVILTFCWWAGRLASARTTGPASRPARLHDFKLPDVYVWPLIGSLALVLADVAFGIGAMAAIAWNAGLIMLFLFGLQGLGIVQFVFARYSVSRTMRVVVYAVLAVMFVSPGANIAVIVGIPALGVSEIWLKYRTRRRKDDADEGDT